MTSAEYEQRVRTLQGSGLSFLSNSDNTFCVYALKGMWITYDPESERWVTRNGVAGSVGYKRLINFVRDRYMLLNMEWQR